MTALSASILSVTPDFLHREQFSCLSCGERLPPQATPCSASLRTNNHVESFRKLSVRSRATSRNSLRRLQFRARHAEPTTIRSVPVQVAHELINAGHHYLDVRTQEEYAAGHVEHSVNIPYLVKAGPGMSKNLKFLEEVGKHFDKDDEILIGCQSGRRSLMAAAELRAANFTGVTDMGGGYRTWKESGLPVNIPHQA